MENHGDPWSWIRKGPDWGDQADSTQLIENPNSSFVFHLEAIPLGCIVRIGPLASQAISSPEGTADWSTAIQSLYPGEELESARKEYDELLSTLLDSDDSKVEKMCFNRPSSIAWRSVKRSSLIRSKTVREYIEYVPRRKRNLMIPFPHPPLQGGDNKSPAFVQPRLYLAASNYSDRYSWPKMGVASGLADIGDVVCWVFSSRRALLVRDSTVRGKGLGEEKVRVFGTALATKDMRGPVPSEQFYITRWKSLEKETRLMVQVDASTIFVLLE
ncbi:hypothetical protein N658DRAFT_531419 [Parathielavia hyrcaniae]|uniref:Uncharacterized protein n=1 Tax=Parathielavia hyrcaniae TaxID=113614 RepID=A0AAN6PT61_9PEZI|nr:hypothetical protein N658DRAFT_531419 [Parathielavia hyrcaniae]